MTPVRQDNLLNDCNVVVLLFMGLLRPPAVHFHFKRPVIPLFTMTKEFLEVYIKLVINYITWIFLSSKKPASNFEDVKYLCGN